MPENRIPGDGHDSRPAPLRVAMVTGSLMLGGATTFLCNLGGELVRRKIAVEVLSFEKENSLASDFSRLNVPVLTQGDRRVIFEDWLRTILQKLAEFRPTVVLANLSATSFEVLRYVPAGVFRVGAAHADDSKVYKMMSQYTSHLDLVGVVSETIHQRMAQLPEFANTSVRYLPLGVPMPGEGSLAAREFTGRLRIIYLGRLDREQKRAHLFPAILDRLQSSRIAFHWTIAGEGPERAALEREMIGTPPTQTVSFTGKVAYADVPRLLSEHDVFLLASDYEGLPLSLVEAMGHGLVPVVSDLSSGIRELVDESTGKRVAPDNVAGYAGAIVWLDGHREAMRRMSVEANRRVRGKFSIPAMTDRWLAAFPTPAGAIGWPSSWDIKAPLASRQTLRFSAPGRLLRRLIFRLRRR